MPDEIVISKTMLNLNSVANINIFNYKFSTLI